MMTVANKPIMSVVRLSVEAPLYPPHSHVMSANIKTILSVKNTLAYCKKFKLRRNVLTVVETKFFNVEL